MKINTQETLTGPVVSLTFTAEDSINELKNERGFCVGLTLDEAADLHAELGRLLSRKPADPRTRTTDDVHDRPEPGDELRWSDGEVWRVTGFDGHRVQFLMMGDQRRGESSLQLRAWSMRNDPDCTFTCVPHG